MCVQMETMTSHWNVFFVALALASSFISATSQESPSGASSTAILISVDPSGKGDFTRIQDAIDAVPSNNNQQVFISIKPGVYREKVVVPADKSFITLSGTSWKSTIITWNEVWDTLQSPTVSILASDFVGRYLTIQNTYGSSGPAIALRVAGDKAAFYTCRILSYQDTLLDESGRHYYSNCYIEGATDFICGNGLSLFEVKSMKNIDSNAKLNFQLKCHLHSMSEIGGAITAQRRSSATENSGYSFIECKVTGVGAGTALLGRPWGNYSRVVFADSYMSNAVLPQGWDDWGDSNNQRTVFYGEYHCYGPGSNPSQRVGWSHQLSSAEALPLVDKSVINAQEWLRPLPTKFRRASNMTVNSGP